MTSEPADLTARHERRVVRALCSGGDSRIACDPVTGLNRYFCAAHPVSAGVDAASCTASPLLPASFKRAAAAFDAIMGAATSGERARRLAEHQDQIAASVRCYFDPAGLAHVTLCPSGTDALLTTAMLLAAERLGEPMTAILPGPAETGTGVPLAAACRGFDGPEAGAAMADCVASAVHVPLRGADGEPLGEDLVNAAFAAAAGAVHGRAITYVTHGSKTGLIAPTAPQGSDVIVDACQARIDPERVAAYLRRGWPVVVTGSKFLGGPAFSGAVLFPRSRLPPGGLRAGAANLGMVLRWTAALGMVETFDAGAAAMGDALRQRAALVQDGLAGNPALVPVGGAPVSGPGWADQPSIFTFAVRDPADRQRLLSVAELRTLYAALAADGVLLGQPVGLGAFGGLRIAIGARDLVAGAANRGLSRLFLSLEALTARHPSTVRQKALAS